MLSQKWEDGFCVEILLYVNCPIGKSDELTSESLLIAKKLESGEALQGKFSDLSERIKSTKNITVRLVYEELEGGLPEVYQRAYSTLLARIVGHVNSRDLPNKEQKVALFSDLMSSTIFCIVDDDQVLKDNHTFPGSLVKLSASDCVVIGQVEITEVFCSESKLNRFLKGLMNVFFLFKYDVGTAVLTPRALLVKDLFHLPNVAVGTDYSDQIWFSSAIGGREKLMVPVSTSIVEEKYPSNAAMLGELVEFFTTGNNPDALDIFRNLKNSYSEDIEGRIFSLRDVEKLIVLLENRDIEEIEKTVNLLLVKC